MNEPNSPVDRRDLELLRIKQPLDPAVRERVRSRLVGVIPIGGGVGPGTNRPAPDDATAATAATRSLASYAMTAVTFVTGGIAGVALYAGLAKPPPERVVYVDRPLVVAPSPAAPSSTEPPSRDSDTIAQTAPAAVTSVAPRALAPKSGPSQLLAERVILDEARAAISKGDALRGLDRLDRHRRLFPNALLAEESDALRVQALVKAARYDEARARADAFRKRAPDSLFLPSVDAAIASIP